MGRHPSHDSGACAVGRSSSQCAISSMTAKLAIVQIVSVEAVEPERFEVRLRLEDTSEVVLVMDGPTLCNLADMVSQYATP